MQKRRLLRFSLAGMLIAISVFAVALGVARWHRQRLLTAYRELHADGVGLVMVDNKASFLARVGLSDFWLCNASSAEIYVARFGPERYKIGHKILQWPETEAYLLKIKERAMALGIDDVQVWRFEDGPFALPPLELRAENKRWLRLIEFADSNGMNGDGVIDTQEELDRRYASSTP